MICWEGSKSSEKVLIIYVGAVFFTLSCGSNAPTSHSFRHHQHGMSRKGFEGVEDFSEGNATSGKSQRLPDLIVKPKEEIYLNCTLPIPTLENIGYAVSWVHNGLVVDTVEIGAMNNGHRYHRDPSTGQLFISTVRLEDDGMWFCQYQGHKTDRPIVSKPRQLIVLDKPRTPYLLVDGRRLDPGNQFIPVKELLELTVTCVVEGGNPTPNIKWVLILSENLDPALVGEDSVNMALNVTDSDQSEALNNRVYLHEQTRSEARLASVQRAHHNATIVCIVQHMTLKTPLNASLLLDVQYSPSFAISREPGFGFPLREGIPVSLKCDVDSNPPSNPVWLRDDGSPPVSQSVDGFLNFTSIKREHSGWYKCTSHHLLGEFSSIGYYLNVRNDLAVNITQDPRLETYPTGRQVEVNLGGSVQLQCPEEAMGCWSRVGANGRLEPVGPGPSLALSNIIYQDAGEYRCVSSKREYDRWRSEVNVDVTVKGRPMVYPSETSILAYTGQRLEVSLEFCANPPSSKAFWITESQRLIPGQITDRFIAHNFTMGSSIHCQQAVLIFKRVREGDEGEYMFLVRSPVGVSEGTVYLNVTRASGFSNSAASVSFTTIFIMLIVRIIF